MIDSLLARHSAFWQRYSANKPLSRIAPMRSFEPRPYPLLGGQAAFDPICITPEDVDLARLIGEDKPLPPLLTGDLFNPLGCVYPEAWMEAIIGCSIYASAFGCVSRPVTNDIDEALAIFSLDAARYSSWLPVMESVLHSTRQRASEHYPVAPLHLRGVVDMLAAYLGEESLCMALCDAPEKVVQLAEQFMELFLLVAELTFRLRGVWQNGVVSCWSLYAPGRQLDYQVDASSLISPELYARYLLPFDLKILDKFPYSLLHIHACGLQHLDNFLKYGEVNAIEINFDRETGDWDQAMLLHTCHKVQQKDKPLLIHAEMTAMEYQEFTDELEPAGLAVTCFERPDVTL